LCVSRQGGEAGSLGHFKAVLIREYFGGLDSVLRTLSPYRTCPVFCCSFVPGLRSHFGARSRAESSAASSALASVSASWRGEVPGASVAAPASRFALRRLEAACAARAGGRPLCHGFCCVLILSCSVCATR